VDEENPKAIHPVVSALRAIETVPFSSSVFQYKFVPESKLRDVGNSLREGVVSGSGTEIPEVVEGISEVVEDTSEVVENISEVLENISEVVEDISEVVEDISEVVEDISEVVEDISEVVENISEVVENISVSAASGDFD
jgi:archaellum component FlaC